MSRALRQRRSRAASALANHARRAQLAWDDLAAWPDWADAGPPRPSLPSLPTLATRVGAAWHAGALRRCIHGPTLKRLQLALGDSTLQALIGHDGAAHDVASGVASHAAPEPAPLPTAQPVEAWLQAQGADVMLAALPSPLLRLALREHFWPQAAPQLTGLDSAAATRAVQRALALTALTAQGASA